MGEPLLRRAAALPINMQDLEREAADARPPCCAVRRRIGKAPPEEARHPRLLRIPATTFKSSRSQKAAYSELSTP